MNFVYPLIKILIYLSLLFAPPETKKITITGPDQMIEITRTTDGWTTTTPDGKPGLVSIAEGMLTVQAGETKETGRMADYVAAAVGHDWAKEPKITLHDATTLEKTAVGYTLRVDDGKPTVRAYAIVYQPAPQAAPAAATIKVNVIGAVNAPGSYTISANATLLDAIAAAKGFNRFSYRADVRLTRGPAGEKPTTYSFDTKKMVESKLRGPELKDGDTVFVPEEVF
jgi:SLBB domain